MGVIKINDCIILDIDDLEGILEKVKYYGTLEKVKYYGTLEEFLQELETREFIKAVYNNEVMFFNKDFIQSFKMYKK